MLYAEGIPFVIFTYSLVIVTNKRTPSECYFNVFSFVIQFNHCHCRLQRNLVCFCAVICKIICYIYRIIYSDSSPFLQLGVFVRAKLGYCSAFPLYPVVSLLTIVLQSFVSFLCCHMLAFKFIFNPQPNQGRYGKLQWSTFPKKVAVLLYLRTNSAEKEDYLLSTECISGYGL